MNRSDRQNQILDLIQRGICTNVKELCSAVYASPATVRRDLHAMEKDGLVRLLYGNIIPLTEIPAELPLAYRESQAREARRHIARHAASLIPPGATVLLDGSASAAYMAEYIRPDQGITVFTNCVKSALTLCENGVTAYLLGGRVDPRSLVTSGSWADENLQGLSVDYFFFSAHSLGTDGIIRGTSESGIRMRRQMLGHARNRYFLCNSEKIGAPSTFRLCHASDLTGVITDADLSHLPEIPSIQV